MTIRFRIPVVAMAAMLTLGVLSPLRAGSTTIDDKKAQAADIEAEIQANGDKIAALCEQYNGAVLDYENSKAAVAEAKRNLAKAEAQHGELSDLVAARGAALYQGAQDPTSLLPNTNIKSISELGARTKYGAVATGNDEQLIANLVRAEQDLTIQRKEFDKQVEEAAKKRDSIAAARQGIEEANSRDRGTALAGEGRDRHPHPAGEGAPAGRAPGRAQRARQQRIEPGQRRVTRAVLVGGRRHDPEPARAVARAPRPRSRTRRRSSASRTSTRPAARTPSTAPGSR